MAASDARPVPRKNAAYRVTFPLMDNDGDLVTGAAGLDSEVSKDGAAFADCTNEATEIGSSGIYYLDLTSTEMNADTVAIIVKTSTTDAKTTPIIMYPEEVGDFRIDTTGIGTSTLDAAGVRTALGLGSANLDTQLAAIDDFLDTEVAAILAAVDTEVAAIKAKTDNLPADPADASDIATSFTTLTGKVDTIDDFLDTEVAAIKAKTDLLPAAPANEATLTTIAAYLDTEIAAILAAVDTEVAAIKAKTDNLPAAPAATGDIPTAGDVADAVLDDVVEGTSTLRQIVRGMAATLLGKASGMGTTTAVFRDIADTKDRITATVDSSGNRTAVTRDLT
jgi:hypothetical protein